MIGKPKDCPCHSGARYAACCKPFHDGAAPPTPEALMRSRYAAFALGLGAYLVETLASTHADRKLPKDALARELGRAKHDQRFLGLRILSASVDGDRGTVWFFARIFRKGEDVSFAERSAFVREGGAWRYADGVMRPASSLPASWESAGEDAFARG